MNGRPFEVACKHHGVKYHAFAKQSPSSWQFLGVYTIHHVDEISLEEWLLESDVVSGSGHVRGVVHLILPPGSGNLVKLLCQQEKSLLSQSSISMSPTRTSRYAGRSGWIFW
jgi:hypothetical protein